MLKAHVWHVLCQLQCRLAPFPDCSVNHSMIKTVPLLPDALPQFFHVRDLVFVDVVLESLPYHKLDRVYIRTVGWPHTHTHTFNGPLSGTTWVSRYQKGKTNLDFTEARDSEWQWHQLGVRCHLLHAQGAKAPYCWKLKYSAISASNSQGQLQHSKYEAGFSVTDTQSFLGNLTVKKFNKSVYICISYDQKPKGMFLFKHGVRYDTRCYFNVRSKADISRLNLPHAKRQLKIVKEKN